MERLTSERGVIVTINAMIVLIMGLLFAFGASGRSPKPIVWVIVYVPPMLAILSALQLRESRNRRIAYLVVSMLMLPAVYFGIWGAWGLLYAIAIIFLLAAAFGRTAKT